MNKPFAPNKPVKGGKPRGAKPVKTTRFEARLTPYARKIIRRAAEIQGRSMSDFVVVAAEQAAEKAIHDRQIIEVALEHQEAFFKAMLNPPKLGPIWRRARETHRRLIARSR